MVTKEFEFDMDEGVNIKPVGITGVVIGLWLGESDRRYNVRWKRNDGGISEQWFIAKDLAPLAGRPRPDRQRERDNSAICVKE